MTNEQILAAAEIAYTNSKDSYLLDVIEEPYNQELYSAVTLVQTIEEKFTSSQSFTYCSRFTNSPISSPSRWVGGKVAA